MVISEKDDIRYNTRRVADPDSFDYINQIKNSVKSIFSYNAIFFNKNLILSINISIISTLYKKKKLMVIL